MSFAVGTGVNLGKATGYLFLDPSKFSKGLGESSREIEKFYKTSAAQLNAAAKATAANDRVSARQAALLNRSGGEISRLQQAAQQTISGISAANRQRISSIQSYVTAQNAATAQVKRALDQEVAAIAKVTAAREELAAIQAKQQATTAFQRGRFVPGGGRLGAQLDAQERAAVDALAGANIELANARIASAKAAQVETAASQTQLKTIQDVIAANAEQIASLKVLEAEFAKAAAAREAAFANSSRAVRRANFAVADAEQAALAGLKRIEAERAALAARRLALPTLDATAQFTELKAIEAAEARLAEQSVRFNQIRANSQRNLTLALEADYEAQVAAATRATQRQEALQAQLLEQRAAASTRLQQVLGSIASKVFVGTGAVIAASTIAFTQFDQAMRNVFAIMETGDQTTQQITAHIQDLSVALGTSPTDLAQGLFEVAQAGFEGEQALGILDVAAKSAVAGMTDVATASKPLIAIVNAYGQSAGTLESINNKLFAGVTEGVFTFEELAQQMGDNIAPASALGVKFDELIALYITLTRVSNSLSESTTQINGIFAALLKPTDAMIEVLNQLGFASGQELLDSTGSLVASLEAIATAVGHDETALAKLFPNIRGLRGVFGALTQDGRLLAESVELVANAQEDGGAANKVLQAQMKSTAFQMKQAKQEFVNTAIALGKQFAPAILITVKAMAGLVGEFQKLQPQTQQLLGGITLLVFGLSGSVVVITKIISAVRALRNDLAILRTEIMAVQAATLASIGVFAALSIVLILLANDMLKARNAQQAHIQQLRDQAEQAKRTEDAYIALNDAIQNFILNQQTGIATQANAVLATIVAATDAVNAMHARTQDAITGIQAAIEQAKKDAKDMQGGSTGPSPENLQAQEDLNALLKQQQGLEADLADFQHLKEVALLTYLKGLNDERVDLDEWGKQITGIMNDVASGAKSPEAALQQLTNLGNNIGRFAKDVDELTPKEQALKEASDQLAGSMQELANQNIATIRGFEGDLVPFISGANTGLAKIGDSAAKIMNRLIHQVVGGLPKGTVSRQIQEAINFQREVERNNQAIADTEDAISTNVSDMSMWQDRIDTVTDALGLNSDTVQEWQRQLEAGEITQETFNANIQALTHPVGGLPELNQLLAEGKINQQEYDDAVEAGTFLIQRSAGGLQDERAEIVKLLPKYAEFVKAHDDLETTFDKLTDTQQAFVLSLRSDKSLLALQTIQLFAYLAALGAIPKEMVTEVILDLAASDPELDAFLHGAGLIRADGTVVFDDSVQKEKDKAKDPPLVIPAETGDVDTGTVDQAKDDINNGKPAVIPTVTGTPEAAGETPTEGGTRGAPQEPRQPKPKPTEQQPTVTNTVKVEFDIDKQGKRSFDQIYTRSQNWINTLTTALTFTGGASGGGEAEAGASSAFTTTYNILKNKWPDKVSTSLDFTLTGLNPLLFFNQLTVGANAASANLVITKDAMKVTFVQIATDASNLGMAAGSGFKNNFINEIDGASLGANAEMGEIRGQLNTSFSIEGQSSARSFVSGFLGVLRGAVSQAYLIGLDIGNATAKGVADATEQGSPSRVAIRLGQNFAESLADGMRNGQNAVSQQSVALASAMNSGFQQGAFSPNLVTTPARMPIGSSVISPGSQMNVVVHQDVTVPAANFPEWIRTMQYVQQLDQGFSTTLASKRGR